ncbi:MAG TPA: UDP-N-acetylmuramate dehydrogenase [Elusimicrobiota bacterium]|nr:UDP-N-acetylmuramate dehydrogenase [Elusimicrobiota bacterium]
MSSGDWRAALKTSVPHARFDEPLAKYTTFKIGGPADAIVDAQSTEDVLAVLRVARDHGVPLFVLGWGSNILVKDRGVRGITLRLAGEFTRVEFLDGGLVRAGAAVRVPQLVVACAERGLAGLEPIVGVPGSVGGALAMNAGTRDGEIGPFVEEILAADRRTLNARVFSKPELAFSYREGPLENLVALSVLLRLKHGIKGDIMAVVARYQQKRQLTQPIHTFNVGSTFKNPPGRFAAQMIEELGLKGRAVGGARVSPLHANFIENFAGAKASDVLALVDLIRERARAIFGVGLELEMRIVGE